MIRTLWETIKILWYMLVDIVIIESIFTAICAYEKIEQDRVIDLILKRLRNDERVLGGKR